MGRIPRPHVAYRALIFGGLIAVAPIAQGYVLIKVDVLNRAIKETKNELKSQLENWLRDNVLLDRELVGEISNIEQSTAISVESAATGEIVTSHDLVQAHNAAFAVVPSSHACRMYSLARNQSDAGAAPDQAPLSVESPAVGGYLAAASGDEAAGETAHQLRSQRPQQRFSAVREDLLRAQNEGDLPNYGRFLSPAYSRDEAAAADQRRQLIVGDAGEFLFHIDHRGGNDAVFERFDLVEKQARASLAESALAELQRSRLSSTMRKIGRNEFRQMMGFIDGQGHVDALFDSLRGEDDFLVESRSLLDWVAATAPLLQFVYSPEDASRPLSEKQKSLFNNVQLALQEANSLRRELQALALESERMLRDLER